MNEGEIMSAYQVVFVKEDGVEKKMVVEALNRFRALKSAMNQAMISTFKDVKIEVI